MSKHDEENPKKKKKNNNKKKKKNNNNFQTLRTATCVSRSKIQIFLDVTFVVFTDFTFTMLHYYDHGDLGTS